MLKIKGLVKKFSSNLAVNQVSFEIKPGEIFSLIGPNGSGKTTIIKIIAGLLQPTAGTVIVGGYDITKEPAKAKQETGYIPDEPAVWPAMTGEEFVHFTGALYGLSEKIRRQRVEELLEVFQLQGIEKEYFEDYSRGNKQKFSILAAFSHQPRLLLIDEPIVGLDPASAKTAEKKFLEFAQSGGAILLATHTLSVAQKISTRLGVLKKGELVTTGTFPELITQANLDQAATLEDVYLSLT